MGGGGRSGDWEGVWVAKSDAISPFPYSGVWGGGRGTSLMQNQQIFAQRYKIKLEVAEGFSSGR